MPASVKQFAGIFRFFAKMIEFYIFREYLYFMVSPACAREQKRRPPKKADAEKYGLAPYAAREVSFFASFAFLLLALFL